MIVFLKNFDILIAVIVLSTLLSCKKSASSQNRIKSDAGQGQGEPNPSLVSVDPNTGEQLEPLPATPEASSGKIADKFLVEGGPKEYQAGAVEFGFGEDGKRRGFYMKPQDVTAKNGLLLLPGIFGLSPKFKEQMQRFVAHGYGVLAIDFYSGKFATSQGEAEKMRQTFARLNQVATISMLDDGRDFLFKKGRLGKVGVVGWDEGANSAMTAVAIKPRNFAALVNLNGNSEILKTGDLSVTGISSFHIFAGMDPSFDSTRVKNLKSEIETKTVHNFEYLAFPSMRKYFIEPNLEQALVHSEKISNAYKQVFSYLKKQFE